MGKTVVDLFFFKKGMQNMLQNALNKRDFSEDTLALAKAAEIIRNDIFPHQRF